MSAINSCANTGHNNSATTGLDEKTNAEGVGLYLLEILEDRIYHMPGVSLLNVTLTLFLLNALLKTALALSWVRLALGNFS